VCKVLWPSATAIGILPTEGRYYPF